jgi:restriction system protein
VARRSLLVQVLTEAQRAKARRERANQQAQAQLMRDWHAEQKAQQQAQAAADREAARRARDAQRQAEKAAADDLKRQKADERAVAAEAARLRRLEAENAKAEREQVKADKERARRELEEDVDTRNHELRRRLDELSGVLASRSRRPVASPFALEDVFNQQGPDEFRANLQAGLTASAYPLGVPAACVVLGYVPEARELIVERELPRDAAIPAETEFRIVKGQVRAIMRKPAETRHLYGQLLARAALRTIAEVFAATPATLINSVVLNGRVSAVDKATGKAIHPHLLSVQFLREEFEDLRLDAPELDPELCLRAQNALISPHPHDLVPVKPLLYYDLDRFKTISGVDYLVDLDSRLDLLTLTPTEFENLIKQLFEARGLKSWQTQASRDDGVDAVVVNEDPVLGGVVVIQAKRYSRIVGYESITALAGVMDDKSAGKGILVTTSWVGKSSRDFAKRNKRIQIIEGRQLKQMLAESLNMDVLISLPVVPTGWAREEIA